MALLTDKFVFFHCPRTAGSWMRDAIERVAGPCREFGPFHAWPAICRDQIGERVTFTLTRDPLAWLQSWYRMLKIRYTGRHGDFTEVHPLLHFHGYDLSNFAAFVEDILKRSPGIVSKIFATYSDSVDFVGDSNMPHHALERILFATGWYQARRPANLTSRREVLLSLLGHPRVNEMSPNVRHNIETALSGTLEQAFRESEARHLSTQAPN